MPTSPDNQEPRGEAPKSQWSKLLQTPMSRRGAIETGIKLAAGAAIATLLPGNVLTDTQPALASNLDGGDLSPEPTPIPPPEKPYKYVRDIGPVDLNIVDGLRDRPLLPITGVVLSPYPDELAGLKPENPHDRAKLIF